MRLIRTARQSTHARPGDGRYRIPNPLFSVLSTKARLLPESPNRTKRTENKAVSPFILRLYFQDSAYFCGATWMCRLHCPRNGIWLILWKIACVVIFQAPKCTAECRSLHSLMTSRIKFFHIQKSSLAVVDTGKIKLQTLIVHRQVSGNSQNHTSGCLR